jgi:hypothetical protein
MELPLALDAPQGTPLRGRRRHTHRPGAMGARRRPCPASASRSPDRMEAR